VVDEEIPGSRSGAGSSGLARRLQWSPRDTEPSTPAARSSRVRRSIRGSVSDATRTIEFPEPRSADPHDSEFRSSESPAPGVPAFGGGRSGSRFSESRQGREDHVRGVWLERFRSRLELS